MAQTNRLMHLLKQIAQERKTGSKFTKAYREKQKQKELGGPTGMEPTRYNTWEHKGKEVDF